MNDKAAPEKQVALQRIYVKDLSFESPGAPKIFGASLHPEIKLNVGTKAKQIDETQFEVIIEVTLNANTNEKSDAFIVEIEQAGLFHVQGLSDEERNHALSVWAPNTLFPYLRQTVDSVLIAGSLPPIMLSPINFEALYQQRNNQK